MVGQVWWLRCILRGGCSFYYYQLLPERGPRTLSLIVYNKLWKKGGWCWCNVKYITQLCGPFLWVNGWLTTEDQSKQSSKNSHPSRCRFLVENLSLSDMFKVGPASDWLVQLGWFGIWTLLCVSQHLTCYTLPVIEMAHNSSNVIIHGGIFSSGHGSLTINNTRDSEFGMHDFMSVWRGWLWRTSYPETRNFSWSDS